MWLVSRDIGPVVQASSHFLAHLLVFSSGQEEWRGQVEQISWSPRAFLYRKLLSDEECDELIKGVSCSTYAK